MTHFYSKSTRSAFFGLFSKPLTVLLFVASLLYAGGTVAQITVNLGNVTTCTPGSVVTVPITVTNFNNIGAVSLDMNYSPTALTYTGFNNSSLTGNLIVNNP